MANYYLELPENSYPKSCKNCWIPCGFAELGSVHNCPFIFTEDEIKKKILHELVSQPIRCHSEYTVFKYSRQELLKAMEEASKISDIISDVLIKNLREADSE